MKGGQKDSQKRSGGVEKRQWGPGAQLRAAGNAEDRWGCQTAPRAPDRNEAVNENTHNPFLLLSHPSLSLPPSIIQHPPPTPPYKTVLLLSEWLWIGLLTLQRALNHHSSQRDTWAGREQKKKKKKKKTRSDRWTVRPGQGWSELNHAYIQTKPKRFWQLKSSTFASMLSL